MSDPAIPTINASGALLAPVLATTDIATLNFEVEHQKQIRLLVLFEDVAKHKSELDSTTTELQQRRSETEELQGRVQAIEVEVAAMQVDFENIRVQHNNLTDSLRGEKELIDNILFRHDAANLFEIWENELPGVKFEASEGKALLESTKKSVVLAFDNVIRFLGVETIRCNKLLELKSFKELLRSRLEAISALGLRFQQQESTLKDAEQTWRSAYTASLRSYEATDQDFEVHRLRERIKDFEIQAKEQTDEIAALKANLKETTEKSVKSGEIYKSFAFHGANIRHRFLENLKPKGQRDEVVLKLGNISAHQGSAIADAYLYQAKNSKASRTDPRHFISVYGFSPDTVLSLKNHSKIIAMIDLRGSITSFCVDQNTSVIETPFFKTFTVLVNILSTTPLWDVLMFRKEEELRSLSGELETHFEEALAKHKAFLKNR
jgi:hypothetical protein